MEKETVTVAHESWHDEWWIKDLPNKFTEPRQNFIEWCAVNKPEYTPEQAGIIYDRAVPPATIPATDGNSEGTTGKNKPPKK